MTFNSLPPTTRAELETIRDSFQAAWKTGEQPRIEDYLSVRTEPELTILVQILLEVDVKERDQAGKSPSREEYLERFDEFTEVVHTLFGDPPPGEGIEPGPPPPTDPREEFTPSDRLATTVSVTPGVSLERPDPAGLPLPARIGVYRVIREVGRGNFVVYHARDDRDGRDVAIKVARPSEPTARPRMMSLAREADRIKSLEHPNIVKLYEYVDSGEPGVGEDGYIVLEYVEGRDGERTLEELFRAGPVPLPRLIHVMAKVAEALHYAHTHSSHVVHRDVKPANILLDLQGEPRVCDLGLAIDEEIQRLRRGEVAGTPPYMAPEQVRGETHLLDNRTDIWALGVILYRGLTGRLPFPGPAVEQVFEDILRRDPRPLRIYEPSINPELEQICLRCLARPMSDRYRTAQDLADDLNRVVNQAVPGEFVPDSVVPKGLKPFDSDDARHFLSLLPGPRRADRIPESIRFWKDRAESSDADKAFSVGLLYGPTGSGKSSFLQAGLLPILDRGRARPIYIEAGPATEARLLEQLRRAEMALPTDVNLPDAVAIIRYDAQRRSRAKLVIVVDQFEQWLHAHPDLPDAELVQALRQCDGRHVQAILVVRDDFWMAATRFLQAVNAPFAHGGNAAPVELFDSRHCRKVLEQFGRALGQLPEAGQPLTAEAARFLEEAASALSDSHGRVIPMQLSLLTEVVRHQPWTPQTLRDFGDGDGIGVRFLHDCFSKPEYRNHAAAAKKVLEKLLPPATSAIRGAPLSGGQLKAAAGLTEQPREFAALLQILAGDLRLITVADGDGPDRGEERTAPGLESRYQLAHDSLVRPVRRWLEREQGSSRKGRAGLRLGAVTASWVQRPGPRQLPSLMEWASILRHIPPREWSTDERRLLRATAKHYAKRGIAALAVIAAAIWGIQIVRARDRDLNVLDSAVAAEPENLRRYLPRIAAQRGRFRAELERVELDGSAPARHRANALLLLHRERPTAERAASLRARLLEAGPEEVELIRDSLAADSSTAGGDLLLEILRSDQASDVSRLRAACALASLAPPTEEVWASIAGDLVRGLLHGEDRRTHPQWLAMLGRRRAIEDALMNVCVDASYDPVTCSIAAEALASLLSARRGTTALAAAVTKAQPGASLILLHELERMRVNLGGLRYLETLAQEPAKPRDDLSIDRQAMATVALAILARPEQLRRALQHQRDPNLRTATIQKIAALNLAPRMLDDRLPWHELDGASRQAVLLAWAETMARHEIPPKISAAIMARARQSFRDDPDPGVHSAAELLIRRWDPDSLPALKPGTGKPPRPSLGGRRWEVGPNGHTLVYLRGPLLFRMGSPGDEKQRLPHEPAHDRRIERSLLVATTETTVAQYQRFKPKHMPELRFYEQSLGYVDSPVGGVSWYEAIRYCNWLSREAGLEPFFPEKVPPGTALPNGGRDRGGFRLPTEAEWEFLCRADTQSSRPFGESDQFINRYAWTAQNSHALLSPTARLLPNEFGLFDTLGNQWEWCLDGPLGPEIDPTNPATLKGTPVPDPFGAVPTNEKDWRYVRGGSFTRPPQFERSAHRDIFDAPNEHPLFGFRVVRTVTPDEEKSK